MAGCRSGQPGKIMRGSGQGAGGGVKDHACLEWKGRRESKGGPVGGRRRGKRSKVVKKSVMKSPRTMSSCGGHPSHRISHGRDLVDDVSPQCRA